MRPIALTMQAFGSYGKKVTIDFTCPKQNLFLITGDTGAGKTTLFDAIVYAIYGEASSQQNKKGGTELVSQFAAPGTEPFVELVFSETAGGEAAVYRVKRIPPYYKKKDRGSGLKSKPETEKVTLLMPDGSTYPSKETNKKLEEIVGLSKSQFMQIAMIAQGEFMELLRAKSDEKKAIFRKLFGTELYQNLTERLLVRKRETEQEFSGIKAACQTVAAGTELPERGKDQEQVQRLAELAAWKKLLLKEMDTAVLEKFMSGLEELCRDLEKDRTASENARDQAEQRWEAAKEDYTRGAALQAGFSALAAAEAALRDCEEAAESVSEKEKRRREIQDSWELESVYRMFTENEKQLQEIRKQAAALEEKLPGLKEGEAAAFDQAKKERSVYEAAAAEYAAVQEKAAAAVRLFEQIDGAEMKASQCRKKLILAGESRKTAEQALAAFEKDAEEWRREEQQLAGIRVTLEQWKQEERKISDAERELEEVRQSEKDARSQKAAAKQAAEVYGQIRARFTERQSACTEYQQAYLDAQAGFIAKNLREDVPCPVCGSREHPNPCRIQESHKNLTRAGLDRLSAEVQTLNRQVNEAAAASGHAVQLYEERNRQAEEKLQKLEESIRNSCRISGDRRNDQADGDSGNDGTDRNNGDSPIDLPELSAEKAEQLIGSWREDHRKRGAHIRKKTVRLDWLQGQLETAEQKRSSLRNALEQMRAAEQTAAEEKAAGEAELKTLLEKREFDRKETALQRQREQKAVFDRCTAARDKAEREARNAGSALQQAETLIRRYRSELPVQEKRCGEAEQRYREQLLEKQLTEEKWKEVVTLFSKASALQLEKEIEAYKKKRSAAEGSRQTALQTIGGAERPDLELLLQKREEAEKEQKACQENFLKLDRYVRENRKVLDGLTVQMERSGEAARTFSRVDHLYSRLAGKITGSRMDIETYVQRCYLQRILRGANRHFLEMSAGQYELRMVEEEAAGQGKNRGLDLTVYSHVTGQVRNVSTLSGGESFMAALAMALGMADQIQEKSAAINLDMMFIDEGFGSLDDHSRSQAVKVLQQMAMGSRLIGIISHVTELKQELDDQLVITKNSEGSHARWQLS